MNKVAITLSILVIFLAGVGWYLFSVAPPKKDIKKFLPQGAGLSFPLKVKEGYKIGVFADLGDKLPRVLEFDQNGVLVASIPAKGKVIALPDEDEDATADREVEILSGLDRPHGIAFEAGDIYVAETDKVVRYQYDAANFKATNAQTLFSLPGGGRHFTRTIRIQGGKLYTSIGSSCDVCVENSQFRASILVSNLDGSDLRVFAKGLRNTVFFTLDSKGRLWGNDMGRDFLGDKLPPDELNLIEDGRNYGWPYCYGNKIRDAKFASGEKLTYCSETEPSKFNYPAHVAPLGITFDSEGNILAAFHGSWNSSQPVGYKIVKLAILGDSVTSSEDFISGWISDGEVLGRPVDLIFDENGRLFVSDDKAGLVYIVTKN